MVHYRIRARDLKIEYNAWINMRHRCYCPINKQYKNYGGRGISVCDEWLNNFDQFIDDIGRKPKGDGTRKGEYSLDRIDNDADYSAGNCRWSTRSVQMNNRSPNSWKRITIDGVTKTKRAWILSAPVCRSSIDARMAKIGMTFEQAITVPKRQRLNRRS